MIPPLVGQPPHLPPGRYRAALDEVLERFVDGFPGSSTRREIWDGFVAYLRIWADIEERMRPHLGDDALLSVVWLAGSFISEKLDPHNLDLSVMVGYDAIQKCKGKPGAKKLVELANREKMLKQFRLSPILIRYRYVQSPFRLQNLAPGPELDYALNRGAFDDFWQRTRPVGEPKGPPTKESGALSRGYLEVEV